MADQDFNIKVVTTADTSGIRQTESALSDLQRRAAQIGPGAALAERNAARAAVAAAGGGEEAGGAFGAKFAHGFERVAIHALGIGAVIGAINQIKELATEINKITESLDKQGEALVNNSRELINQSQFARTDADVLKIGEVAMKNIAEQHKTVKELQEKELNLAASITEEALKLENAVLGTNTKVAARQRLEEELAQSLRSEQAARVSAYFDVLAGKTVVARRETQTFDQTVGELTDRIREQQALADTHWANKDIASYQAVAETIGKYKKELGEVIKLEEARIKVAVGAAKPLTQDLLTPTGEFVSKQAKAEREHQAERAALRQQLTEADATGDTERAKGIRDQLSHDRFERDQRKEELQRYLANQESLFSRTNESQGDMIRDLGSLGAKKYESAQAELKNIFEQQRTEGKSLSGGNEVKDYETHRLLQEFLRMWQ